MLAALLYQECSRAAFRDLCVRVVTVRDEGGHRTRDSDHGRRYKAALFRVYGTAAEMVIRSYIERVFEVLTKRASKCEAFSNRAKVAKEQLLAPLSDAEINGHAGLHHDMVQRMIRSLPRVANARVSPRYLNKNRLFAGYQESGKWLDRIRGLVLWDDLGSSTRRWDNEGFRSLTRQLYGIVLQELGEALATTFLGLLTRTMARRLLIILQYDLDTLAVQYKPNKAHSENTKYEIRQMNALQKTNWYLASFSPDCGDSIIVMQHMALVDEIGDGCDLTQAKRRLRDEVEKVKLEVSTGQTKHFLDFKDPDVIDLNIETEYLDDFDDDVKTKGNSNDEV